jgi:hypothetical protein
MSYHLIYIIGIICSANIENACVCSELVSTPGNVLLLYSTGSLFYIFDLVCFLVH